MPINDKSTAIPPTMADLEWIWVLTSPITKNRDSILTIEMEDAEGLASRVMPIFETREAALAMRGKLCPGLESEYAEHTMRLGEAGKFAARENLEMMLLDENGRILARLEASMEESSVH